jgi:exopolysaccharide production protein ExoZ
MHAWLERHFELAADAAGRNQPMEGLRGVAVLLVFMVHYSTDIKPWIGSASFTGDLAYGLFLVGNTGVDLFFVLSGYLIYGTLLSKARSYGKFMARRVERIYPAFLAVFVLYVAIGILMPQESKLPVGAWAVTSYLAANLLLLPGMTPIKPLIQVAWSLSYEFFFYLVCPLLIATLGMRQRGSAQRMLIVLMLSSAWLVWSLLVSDSHVRLVMFGAGMLLHEVCQNPRFSARHASGLPAFALALAGYFLMVRFRAPTGIAFLLLFGCYFVLCHEAFTRQGLLSSLLTFAPLRWLGNMSYSFYLLHALMIHAAFFALQRVLPPSGDTSGLYYLLAVPVFAVAVAGSAVLFLLVERPYSLGRPFRPPRLTGAAAK